MKRFLALILALIMVVSLVACGGTPAASGSGATSSSKTDGNINDKQDENIHEVKDNVEYKEEVIIGMSVKVDDLDPQANNEVAVGYMNNMTHERLVFYNSTGKVVGQLAESWEVSSDAKTYTFKLRQGVKFHDGNDFTADDVIYTIQRGLEEATSHSFVKSNYGALESYTAEGDYTVKLVLKEGNSDFLVTLASTPSFSILSKEACTASKEGYKIGTGPWTNKEFVIGDYILLDRNDNYWGEIPVTKTVRFRYIPEASARLIALENGETDVCIYPDTSEYQFIQSNSALDMVTYEGGLNYLFFNLDHAPFDDENFRLALAYATDIDSVIRGAFGGYAVKATTTNAPYSVSYFDDWASVGLTEYSRDLDKAKEYLAKSKYANGGGDFTITVNNSTRALVAQVLQDQYKDLGIKIEVEQLDGAGFTAVQSEDNWQTLIASIAYSATGSDFGRTFLSDGGSNKMGYSNSELDALMKQAKTEPDDAKRLEIYKKAQTIIHQENPAMPLYYAIQAVAYNTKLSGVYWDRRGHHEFAYVKVEK